MRGRYGLGRFLGGLCCSCGWSNSPPHGANIISISDTARGCSTLAKKKTKKKLVTLQGQNSVLLVGETVWGEAREGGGLLGGGNEEGKDCNRGGGLTSVLLHSNSSGSNVVLWFIIVPDHSHMGMNIHLKLFEAHNYANMWVFYYSKSIVVSSNEHWQTQTIEPFIGSRVWDIVVTTCSAHLWC